MKLVDVPQIAEMSVEEKILFVEELWDTIAVSNTAAMPQSHKDELDRREKSSKPLLSANEFHARIEC